MQRNKVDDPYMKLWKRAVEAGLKEELSICEHQNGFLSNADAVLALRI